MGRVLSSGVRRSVGLSGLALVVCLGGALLATTPAEAVVAPVVARTADNGGGTSAVSGTLVVPGPAASAGGVTVTLTGVPKTGDAITRTAVSRADGTFTFRDLAGGEWIYTVTAPYQGTTFSTDAVTVPAGQGTTVKLPLFASTESAAKVRTTAWTVWLDATGDRIAVQQDVAYTNLGTAAYTGTIPVSGTTPVAKAAVQLPVVPGADHFQYLGRFEVCCSATTDTDWAHTRPINPGGSSGTLRYEAPVVSSLAFRAQFPTDTFTMLVPEGMTVSSAQLSSEGTSTDRGITYKVYKTTALKAGDTVTVSLTTPAVATTAGGTPWWVVLLLIVVLVAAAAVGVWVFLRRRRPSPPPSVAAAPRSARPSTADGTKTAKGRNGTKGRQDAGAKGAGAKAVPAAGTEKAAGAKAVRAAGAANATGGLAATEHSPAPATSVARASTPSTTPVPVDDRSRAEVLAEELAQLDVTFEDGGFSDEAAYRLVRESLVRRLVETVEQDPTALSAGDAGTPASH